MSPTSYALLVLLASGGVAAPGGTAAPNPDPCGMVPPILNLADGSLPIERIGAQKTYVFYRDGIESFAIRPAFRGRVDEFGMLIPFPTPPAIKKAPDELFEEIARAIDPPEVIYNHFELLAALESLGYGGGSGGGGSIGDLSYGTVEVLREEAVGMYDVAVLDAGSAEALARWMDAHGYRYPEGMDEVCQEYVDRGWCFVAVKARIGALDKVQPRPGMRQADPSLPAGATFDGAVQAMSFRFRTDELVVPMRLSAFNPTDGGLHNVVYLLTEGPRKVRGLSADLVRRQIPGAELLRNLRVSLPVRVIGSDSYPDHVEAQRDPAPHNARAKELFAADLFASGERVLDLRYEELEKKLLAVGERLGLRGSELDDLHAATLAAELEAVAGQALDRLEDLTLTVIDGDFDREVLAADDLRFDRYTMPAARNHAWAYDAKVGGPPEPQKGRVYTSVVTFERPRNPAQSVVEPILARSAELLRLHGEPGEAAEEALWALQAETANPPLLRTWAAAAYLTRSGDLSDLLRRAEPLSLNPTLEAWLGKALVTRLSDPQGDLGILMRWRRSNADAIVEHPIRHLGPEPLLALALGAEDPKMRRRAAAWLATLGTADGTVVDLVQRALTFDPEAEEVPWAGGALFLPGLNFDEEQSEALFDQLMRWHLASRRSGRDEVRRQVEASFWGLNLRGRGNATSQSPDYWLQRWGNVVGIAAFDRAVRDLGLGDDPTVRQVRALLP